MNRLNSNLSPHRLARQWGLFLTFLCFSAFAVAQGSVRTFPATAQRGVMQITSPPDLLMNGQPERLSPGARIRGTNRMLVMSGSLVGQQWWVNFLREPNGLIHDVWILTNDELQNQSGQPQSTFPSQLPGN